MAWKLIKDLSPYEDWFSPADQEDKYGPLMRRVYSLNGKKYPIIQIAIHSNPESLFTKDITGISISNCIKRNENSHWDERMSSIPIELIPELQDMIESVKVKILKGNE